MFDPAMILAVLALLFHVASLANTPRAVVWLGVGGLVLSIAVIIQAALRPGIG